MSIYLDIARAHGWAPEESQAEKDRRHKERVEAEKKEKEQRHNTVHTIKVTIVRAEFVAPSDSNGLSDPYVKFGASTSESLTFHKTYKTPTVKENLNPTWNYSQTLEIHEDESLVVELYDEDTFKDDFLGANTIPRSGWSSFHVLHMKQKDKPNLIFGQIHIQIEKLNTVEKH